MYCRWLRGRSNLARLTRIFILSTCAALGVFLTSVNTDTNATMHERIHKTISRLVTFRTTPDHGGGDREIVVGDSVNTSSIHLDHKDLAGEWFERPMVLRDPDMRSVIQTYRSSSPPDLTFISIDFKIGPIFAIKHELQRHGVRIIDKSLSSYCHVTSTCSDLKIMDETNGLHMTDDDVTKFWRRYRRDSEFTRADGFICIYPISMCELLVPFNKTIIMIVDNRYELGRTSKKQWISWNEHFIDIVNNLNNIVVATNSYDMEYVRYFTGVELPVVPYACNYITRKYDPRHPSYLLMPVKKDGFEKMILDRFRTETVQNSMTGRLEGVTDVYGASYTTEQLSQHAGIVIVPHQVSYLAMTEIMRLNIPLYLPTVELLSRWHADSHVMDRSLHQNHVHSKTSKRSPIPASTGGLPDPNEDSKLWAIGFWLTFSEYFSWPGIKHFDSVEDLAMKINATTGADLYYASHRALVFNQQERDHVRYFWKIAIGRLKAEKIKYF